MERQLHDEVSLCLPFICLVPLYSYVMSVNYRRFDFIRCTITEGLDVRGADDEDGQNLINSILNGTVRQKDIDLGEEMSVTSLNAVSLVNTTDDELRDPHLDLP